MAGPGIVQPRGLNQGRDMNTVGVDALGIGAAVRAAALLFIAEQEAGNGAGAIGPVNQLELAIMQLRDAGYDA